MYAYIKYNGLHTVRIGIEIEMNVDSTVHIIWSQMNLMRNINLH